MSLFQDRMEEKIRARQRRAALHRVKAKWARVAKVVYAAPNLCGQICYFRDGVYKQVATMDDVAYLRRQFVLDHYSHGSWSKLGSNNPRKNHWCGSGKDRLTQQEKAADLRSGDFEVEEWDNICPAYRCRRQ
jgi:hypothetical protein